MALVSILLKLKLMSKVLRVQKNFLTIKRHNASKIRRYIIAFEHSYCHKVTFNLISLYNRRVKQIKT
jgi:hypothetical protein